MKKNLERFYPFIIFLFAFLLYANTISNDYNLDDELVTINHRTTSKGFDGIKEIFTSYYYEDDMGYKYDYRPITHLSFALEHQFFGESPQISHAVNVILYSLLTLLIFYLVNRLAPDKGPLLGFIVALIFAVHPIHTEVVASIKNRDEILSLLFGLFSFFIVLNAEEMKAKNVLKWFLSLGFFALGFLSKNSVVSFIFLIPLALLVFSKGVNYFLLIAFYTACLFFIRSFIDLNPYIFICIVLFGDLILIILWLEKKELLSRLPFTKLNLVLSVALYLIISTIGVIYKSLDHITLALLLVLVLNESKMAKSKVLSFSVFIITTIFFLLYAVNLYTYESLILLMYLIIVLAPSYRLLWILFVFIQFPSISDYSILYFSFIFILISSLFIDRYFKYRFYKLFHGLRWILFLGLFLLGADKLVIDPDPMLQATENVVGHENSSIELDRPVLEVENPIIEYWDIEHRSALALNSNSFYVAKLIIPYPLSFYYGYDEFKVYDFKDWQTIVAIILFLILLALGVYLLFRAQYLAFFALFALELSIIPYSNLLTPVAGIVGERLAFTASFGFSFFVGVYLYQLLATKKLKLPVLAISALLLIVSCGFVVYRNALWKDKLTLFEHDIKHVDSSAQAHALLASAIMESLNHSNNAYSEAEAFEAATFHFEKALIIYPNFMNWWYDLGRINVLRNKLSDAELHFQEALRIDSSFYLVYYNLLDIYKAQLDYQKIEDACKNILALESSNLKLSFELSTALYMQGKYEEVLALNDKIIALDPNIPEAYLNKAFAYAQMTNKDSCLANIEKAKLISPNHPEIENILNILN